LIINLTIDYKNKNYIACVKAHLDYGREVLYCYAEGVSGIIDGVPTRIAAHIKK
jgi:hypothetical protein